MSRWFYAAAERFTQAMDGSVVELFNRSAQVDVEIGGQFPKIGAWDGPEIDQQGFLCEWIVDSFKEYVVSVVGVSIDQHLAGEDPFATEADGEVDVGSSIDTSGRIGYRFYSAEIVFSFRACEETTVTLEIQVALVAVLGVAGMQILSVVVRLPDFHECVSDGFAGLGEYASS